MKYNLRLLFQLTIFCFAAGVGGAFAQDEGMQEVEMADTEGIQREKFIYSPGESNAKYVGRPTSSPKDSLLSNQTIVPAPYPKVKTEKPAPATKSTVEK